MKTLHVETGRHLYGGPQQVLYLLDGLRRRGEDVLLVCPPESDIRDAASDAGIVTAPVPCRGDLDIGFVGRLKSVIEDARPDLVHCHSRRGADLLGGLAARSAGVPAVLSRRVDNPESRLLAALRYRRFDRVVAISAAIRDVLLDAGVEGRKIVVIRDAVDLGRFSNGRDRDWLNREFGLPDDAQVVASAAQFIERKGQRFLVDAVAELTASHPRLQVLLFGKGPLEASLRDKVQALGLGERVHLAGFRSDLDDFLGSIDLFVHTATAEGMGVVTLKAAAAGVPVVAFDAGGVPEAVADRQTGELVEAGNASALAAAIGGLLDDTDRRARYADASRAHAEQFSIDAMVTAHLDLYRAIQDKGYD